MNKFTLALCLMLCALNSTFAHKHSFLNSSHARSTMHNDSFLKKQIQKNKISEQKWSKQADEFIGLKRSIKINRNTTTQIKSGPQNLAMLTSDSFLKQISNI